MSTLTRFKVGVKTIHVSSPVSCRIQLSNPLARTSYMDSLQTSHLLPYLERKRCCFGIVLFFLDIGCFRMCNGGSFSNDHIHTSLVLPQEMMVLSVRYTFGYLAEASYPIQMFEPSAGTSPPFASILGFKMMYLMVTATANSFGVQDVINGHDILSGMIVYPVNQSMYLNPLHLHLMMPVYPGRNGSTMSNCVQGPKLFVCSPVCSPYIALCRCAIFVCPQMQYAWSES